MERMYPSKHGYSTASDGTKTHYTTTSEGSPTKPRTTSSSDWWAAGLHLGVLTDSSRTSWACVCTNRHMFKKKLASATEVNNAVVRVEDEFGTLHNWTFDGPITSESSYSKYRW